VIRGHGRASAGPVAGLFVLSLLWGAAFPIQKVLLDQSGPAWIAAMRALVAAAVLAPVWFSAGARLGVRGHLIAALSGSCNVGLFFGLQAAGIDHLAPGVAAACVFTQPVFVLVLGHCVLGERIGVVAAVAATMVVLGVWLASAGGRTASGSGVLLLLLAAFGWAWGTVLLRMGRGLPAWRLVAGQCGYGCAPLLVLALATGRPPSLSATGWLAVAYLGVCATALGWWLLAVGLRSRPAWQVSAVLGWTPAVAVVISVLLGRDELTWVGLLGLVMIAAGTVTAALRTTSLSVRADRA